VAGLGFKFCHQSSSSFFALNINFYYLKISLVKLITVTPKAREEIGEYHCEPSM
jgi:hypothetical protein